MDFESIVDALENSFFFLFGGGCLMVIGHGVIEDGEMDHVIYSYRFDWGPYHQEVGGLMVALGTISIIYGVIRFVQSLKS